MACTILGECTPFVDVPFFWSQRYAIAIDYVGHLEPWETFEIEGSYSDPTSPFGTGTPHSRRMALI